MDNNILDFPISNYGLQNLHLLKHLDNIDFFGLKVSVFNKVELLEYCNNIIFYKQSKVLYGYSLGTIPQFKKNPELYSLSNNFDVLVTDGRLFYLLVKSFGFKLKLDLSIPEMVRLVLTNANINHHSVMLLGATKKLNERAAVNIHLNYPNISIIEGIDGYFPTEKEHDVINIINEKQPNILLIGMPSPRKEKLAQLIKDQAKANIIIPCGGMIDVLSRKTLQTPRILKKLGLASPFRVAQEPKRLFFRELYFNYEILCKILPSLLYNTLILKNKDFFIPGIYNIITE